MSLRTKIKAANHIKRKVLDSNSANFTRLSPGGIVMNSTLYS
jgi:hypothetical protein